MTYICWRCEESFEWEHYEPLCPACEVRGAAQEQERQQVLARAEEHAEELRRGEGTTRPLVW
jgi:Zn finger protein HypA/HybF involved in hydrogenase expression